MSYICNTIYAALEGLRWTGMDEAVTAQSIDRRA